MPRYTEGPWFRASKNAWYAYHGGKQVALRVRGEENKKEAVAAWHRLMAGVQLPHTRPTDPTPMNRPTVRAVADEFLTDVRERLKPATAGMYEDHLAMFCRAFGKQPVGAITPPALSRWLTGLGVSTTTQAIRLRSVSAFLGWCVIREYLPENPAKKVPKPKSRSRSGETLISDADHEKLLAVATKQFRVVLRVLHATGCRPGEVAGITVENFDPSACVVKLADHKTSRTGKVRLIFLPPDVCELMKEQASRVGSGPLLRSKAGMPWTGRAITQAMKRLREKAGVRAIAYGYRHSFATAGLANGVPDATVAALLGHSSTAMIHRHYSHLTSQAAVLREAAGQCRPV